jgi:hypothetical protein
VEKKTKARTKGDNTTTADAADASSADAALLAKGGGKGKTKDGGKSPRQAEGAKRICFDYQRGACTRCPCQFLHEKGPN